MKSRTCSTSWVAAMSCSCVSVSMPKKHGQRTGGDVIRMCTSVAPPSRSSSTSLREVLPRTIESSHHDKSLALDRVTQRVELEPDALLTDVLRGRDERAADVAVLHESLAVRNARLLRVADCRRDAGVGHAHHQIGLDGAEPRHCSTHAPARLVQRAVVEHGVGACEVDELEDAQGWASRQVRPARPRALRAELDHLAGRDIADVLGADDVETARLARDDPTHARRACRARAGGRRRDRGTRRRRPLS